jgi:hypothetical protein
MIHDFHFIADVEAPVWWSRAWSGEQWSVSQKHYCSCPSFVPLYLGLKLSRVELRYFPPNINATWMKNAPPATWMESRGTPPASLSFGK